MNILANIIKFREIIMSAIIMAAIFVIPVAMCIAAITEGYLFGIVGLVIFAGMAYMVVESLMQSYKEITQR